MGPFRKTPWNGIKSNLLALVKSRLGLLPAALAAAALSLVALPPGGARAEDPSPPPETNVSIRVRTYPVEIFSRSRSNKMYLVRDVDDVRTRVGRIVLLKGNDQPRMAFRVLKTYYKSRLFAARRVRRYEDLQMLEPGEAYTAYEKIDELPPPDPTTEDLDDIEELEDRADDLFKELRADAALADEAVVVPASGPSAEEEKPEPVASPAPQAASDEDLSTALDELEGPATEAPPPESKPKTLEELDTDDEGAGLPLTVDEVQPFDTNTFNLGVEFGTFRSAKLEQSTDGKQKVPKYYSAGGLRLGITIGRMLFAASNSLQDSLVVEGGAFVFKVNNIDPTTTDDAYSVLPLVGTLRYSLLFSEDLALFFYGGMSKSLVYGNAQQTEDAIAVLAGPNPAAGAGMIFRIGPNWEARVDLGIDMLGAGVMLRF